jgi:hypothetical protein
MNRLQTNQRACGCLPSLQLRCQDLPKAFCRPVRDAAAYRKSDGHSFPCWPKDICHKPDGDIIPDFLSDPAYLGEFRKASEPLWNHAVEALKARSIDMRDKLHIAGYAASWSA